MDEFNNEKIDQTAGQTQPQEPSQPYPQEPSQPYPQEPSQPYPQEPSQPYPQQPSQPYPQQPTYNQPTQPYGQQPYQQPYQYGQVSQQPYGIYGQEPVVDQGTGGNGLAVASLICGIVAAVGVLCCCCFIVFWYIPFILSILSLIFGIVAKAKKTQKSGVAVAGIIIGAICAVITLLGGIFMYVPSDLVTKSARESLIENGFDRDEVDEFLTQKRSMSEVIAFIFEHAADEDYDYSYNYDYEYNYEMPEFDDILNNLE